MSMNDNVVHGKWKEIKGNVQKAWGRLTDDELEKTKGDLKAIGGLIQQRYGEAEEKYGKKLNEIFEGFDAKKDSAMDEVKNTIKN